MMMIHSQLSEDIQILSYLRRRYFDKSGCGSILEWTIRNVLPVKISFENEQKV